MTVVWDGGEQVLSFYGKKQAHAVGRSRSGQARGHIAEASLVVVQTLTREKIEASVAAVAERGFVDI